MKSKKFHTIIANTPQEVKEEIHLSMDILDRINYLLELKFEGKQKLLAEKLGKSEAEVSKWFNGVQNFTIRTIAKLQIAFGENIIGVCTDDIESTFMQVKVPVSMEPTTFHVKPDGSLNEEKIEFQELVTSRKTFQSKTH